MATRRVFLSTAAVIACGSLSGCSTSVTGSRDIEKFKQTLAENDINVVDQSYLNAEKTVELSYIPQQGNQNALANEIGTISGVFYDHVREGWEATRLNGTLLSKEQAPIATWFVKVEWYEQLQANELSANELSVRILNTLSRVD